MSATPVVKRAEIICLRWLHSASKTQSAVEANFENVRDFADGVFADMDTLQLDLVAEKACALIAEANEAPMIFPLSSKAIADGLENAIFDHFGVERINKTEAVKP